MATLTAKRVVVTGTTPEPVAADAAGDSVAPSGTTFFRVKNGGASAITVTVVVPGKTRWQQDQPDVPVAVAAGAEALIGPAQNALADRDTGLVTITYSDVTSVTVDAIVV